MSADKSNGNGKVTVLLWLNTILTALLLPMLAFVGSQVWNKVESNAVDLIEVRYELSIVKERQSQVLSQLPKLTEADERFRVLIEEHLRQTGKTIGP